VSARRPAPAPARRPLLPGARRPAPKPSTSGGVRNYGFAERAAWPLATGQRFRLVARVATMPGERPASAVDRALSAQRVTAVLGRVATLGGHPPSRSTMGRSSRRRRKPSTPGHTATASSWRSADRAGPATIPVLRPSMDAGARRVWTSGGSAPSRRPARAQEKGSRRKDYTTSRPPTALGNQSPADVAATWHTEQANREVG
jgi:hypothetical protein